MMIPIWITLSTVCFMTPEYIDGRIIPLQFLKEICVQQAKISFTEPGLKAGETAYRVIQQTSTACDVFGHEWEQLINPDKRFEAMSWSGRTILHLSGVKCPVCGVDMYAPNSGTSCAVLHLDGKCSLDDPVCPNEKNHGIQVCKMCGKHREIQKEEKSFDELAEEAARETDRQLICGLNGHWWLKMLPETKDDIRIREICKNCNKVRRKVSDRKWMEE